MERCIMSNHTLPLVMYGHELLFIKGYEINRISVHFLKIAGHGMPLTPAHRKIKHSPLNSNNNDVAYLFFQGW